MAKVELKQPIVAAIAEDVKDAASVVLVDYRGLTVAQDTELRKQLREAGIIYKVCKNTMMKRAFEGTDFAGLNEYLEGPSAIAISKDDATAPARIICKFAKGAEKLEVKAGVVEGTVYDVAGVQELIDQLFSRAFIFCFASSKSLQSSRISKIFLVWFSSASSLSISPKFISSFSMLNSFPAISLLLLYDTMFYYIRLLTYYTICTCVDRRILCIASIDILRLLTYNEYIK